jgi:hypothetical protein
MTEFVLITIAIIIGITTLVFLSKRRKGNVDYNRLIDMLDSKIFPGGADQKKEGARRIMTLLKNRISLQDAEIMYVKKIALFYFEKYDSNNEPLIQFLRHHENYGINFFESIELHNFFVKVHQEIESESWNDAFLRLEVISSGFNRKYDYRILEVNSEFEKLFNLVSLDLHGRSIRQVYKNFDTLLSDKFKQLNSTNQFEKVDYFDNQLNKRVSILAYTSLKGQIVTLISEIPEHEAGRSVKTA